MKTTVTNGRPIGRVKAARSKWYKARSLGFLAVMYLFALAGLYTGFTLRNLLGFVIFYSIMCFTAGPVMHRYFGHRTFQTSRWFQFVLALFVGCLFTDAIGFAGRHRLHHKFADTSQDVHSPHQGFWFCWFGSILDDGYTDDEILAACKDWAAYPELFWLHRYFYLPGLIAGVSLYLLGGFGVFAIIYCLNFIVVVNAISAINYFCHKGGQRNFVTDDGSSNRLLLGILFFGEGWHNNHHHYPASARFGRKRYEFDAGYQMLRALAATGLIWDLR